MEKLIMIGESENYIEGMNSFEKVKEILEKYKPVFVLSERMENNNVMSEWDFVQIMKKKKLSNMTSINDVKELIKFCHRKNIKLVGIDFKNFLMNKKQQNYVKKQGKFAEDDKINEELEALSIRRKRKHIKMIHKHLKISRKPIIVIVNAKELEKKSMIRKEFKDLETEIKLIYPANEKGEIVIGPTKEKLRWEKETI